MQRAWLRTLATLSLCLATMDSQSSEARDDLVVARLDTEFQAAVKHNDAVAMGRILHPAMVLVLGDGRVLTREMQLQEAREQINQYERQEEDAGTQVVRVWGNTAVVTARLWIKGTSKGRAFDRRLWFSDTYVRTPAGWQYAFGQASAPLADLTTQSALLSTEQ